MANRQPAVEEVLRSKQSSGVVMSGEGQPLSGAFVVMAKAPRAGRVKTRLCPPLTSEAAAGLYRAFLLDVLEAGQAVGGVDRYVFVDPPDAVAWFRSVAPGYQVETQIQAPLGERLVHVFQRLFNAGHGRVVVRNSDSPDLPTRCIEDAFAQLDHHDLVLGPDQGGGYYLVGLSAPCPALFVDVPMSSEGTRAATLAVAEALGLRVHLLEPWLDVDEGEDLDRLRRHLSRAGPTVAARTRRCLESDGFFPEHVNPG